MDKLSVEKRSENMSHIHGKDTKPEILVRKYLFKKGMRFRKNDSRLPGHPDVVLPKYKTVIFVNGCFWHGHKGCKYAVTPEKNHDFWVDKINSNISRDNKDREELEEMGWRVITVWTCQLRNRTVASETLSNLYNQIAII